MDIVTAGLHHRNLAAHEIFRRRFARVRQAGLLLHGQPVEIAADEQRWAGAVFEHGDHAIAAEFFRDLETRRAQFARHLRGRFLLHERKLGVQVEILVERIERGVVGGDALRYELAQRGINGEERCREDDRGKQEMGGFHFGSSLKMRPSSMASV